MAEPAHRAIICSTMDLTQRGIDSYVFKFLSFMFGSARNCINFTAANAQTMATKSGHICLMYTTPVLTHRSTLAMQNCISMDEHSNLYVCCLQATSIMWPLNNSRTQSDLLNAATPTISNKIKKFWLR